MQVAYRSGGKESASAPVHVRFGAAVAGLSASVDLAMGRRPGHAQATAALSIRLAQRLGLSDREIREMALAALLKDAG